MLQLAVSRIYKLFEQVWLNLVEGKSHQVVENDYGKGKDM